MPIDVYMLFKTFEFYSILSLEFQIITLRYMIDINFISCSRVYNPSLISGNIYCPSVFKFQLFERLNNIFS